MSDTGKKPVKIDKIFIVITVIYLVLCFVIWVVVDSSRNSSYVKPLPLETAAEGEIIPESQKIDINTASADELMKVSGIGEVTARSIIEYRERNGGFLDLDELREVKGIGSKTLEKLRPYLKVN